MLATLFFCLLAVRTLNTAIECLVDHVTSQWEEFARDARDLRSLAAMLMLFAIGIFPAAIVLRAIPKI